MRLGIMQPYLFPYLGYYQLVNAVEQFVFYDDVHFIKKGWINRNAVLVNKAKHPFTIPLTKPSQNVLIKDTMIGQDYGRWLKKFLKTIEAGYKKAAFFEAAFDLIRQVLHAEEKSISQLAAKSIEAVASYAGCTTVFSFSSDQEYDHTLKGQDKILALCKKMAADTYVNLPGGKHLYKPETFKKQDLRLQFIEPEIKPYRQFSDEFISHLSIIDALMFNSPESLKSMLSHYKLTEPNHG